MTEVSFELPEIGEVSAAADPRTLNALVALRAWVNGTGNVSESQLAAAVISKLNAKATGLESQKSIIATEQSRETNNYGTLATPDEVTVSLAENGLIAVAYQATWKESIAGAGRAAIFLGANQLKIAIGGGGPGLAGTAATAGGGANVFRNMASGSMGLWSTSGNAYTGDVTTGQVIGMGWKESEQQVSELGGTLNGIGGVGYAAAGPCYLFAAAGTYKVTVQFKASSGKVTAKSRKLWAWTIS